MCLPEGIKGALSGLENVLRAWELLQLRVYQILVLLWDYLLEGWNAGSVWFRDLVFWFVDGQGMIGTFQNWLLIEAWMLPFILVLSDSLVDLKAADNFFILFWLKIFLHCMSCPVSNRLPSSLHFFPVRWIVCWSRISFIGRLIHFIKCYHFYVVELRIWWL